MSSCGSGSRDQCVAGPFLFIFVLICRFQPQDMEVQLSDEMAGSLRQLKVPGQTAPPLASSSALTFACQDAVFIFNEFWVVLLSLLYCLIPSLIPFSNAAATHFPPLYRDCFSFI